MKLQARQVDGFLSRPDPRIRAVLFYGPDSGLVRERAVQIARTVVEDLSDPFRVSELGTGAVASDPARLHDEMAAMSLMGGRRLVRLVEAEDAAAPAFQALLKDLPAGDSLCVVEAGDLGPRSKLRTLFEENDRAAAIACYVEDAGALAQTLGAMLAEHRLEIDPDARTLMASYLVGDRQIARGEVNKLAIYMMGHGSRVSLADVQAMIGDSSSQEMDEPALAAADGDLAAVDRALGRLFAEGANPVPILRAGQRHFQRLQLAAAHMARGQSAQQALKQLRPPVFFKQEAQMAAQLRRWSGPLLRQALARLVETEAEVKRTHTPAETVTARAFFQLAQLARRG